MKLWVLGVCEDKVNINGIEVVIKDRKKKIFSSGRKIEWVFESI